MTAPFVIFALPRSRTAWLSRFLTYGNWVCCHDAIRSVDSTKKLRELLALPYTGICETAMSFAAPLIRKHFPDAKFVVVRRPLEDIEKSLSRWPDFHAPHDYLVEESARLDLISAMPGTLTVTFDELRTEAACKAVFEHCTGQVFDADWWTKMDAENVQCNMVERAEVTRLLSDQVTALRLEVSQLMSPVTIQEEDWATFFRDFEPLGVKHYLEAGPLPNMPFDPAFHVADFLAGRGALQIVTARAAGFLVGYIAFIIEPHPESKGILVGNQNTFYVLPHMRGHTGLRLHRFAIARLKEKGVKTLTLRAGVRAEGPRQDALFRRLGAKEYGRLYSLWIGD